MSELELLDILLPKNLEHGPLAIGWWLLIGLVLILLTGAALWAYKAIQRRAAKRQALAELSQLKTENATAAQLNQLLKRAALAYYPRERVAALSDTTWFEFLDEQSQGRTDFCADLFVWQQSLYAAPQPANLAMFACAERWLKLALPPKPLKPRQPAQETQAPNGPTDDTGSKHVI
jgi:hypothetical protein